MDYRVRNPQTFRYRVVVFDEDREVWIVKASGVTKQEGMQIVKQYYDKGITARIKIND